ncbi:hypothetical protein K6L05_08610 [Salinicoccus roseus]|uniref:hypothetical protein n=1 Tax=Salinicoccus roseus TaxID=45670 RepID=UPI001CA6E2A1|nr:hypothetical protein [Salinicoccus roseus]MBY8909852.1 hypothetical protein [Salinicoccus roseus]
MYKILNMSLMTLFVFTSLLGSIVTIENYAFAKTITLDSKNEEDFIYLIKNDDFYLKYEDIMLNKEFETITEILDSEGNANGRIARIELEYNQDENNIVNNLSYLIYALDYESQEVQVFLLDNSEMYEEAMITINYLNSGAEESVDISDEDFYQEYKQNVDMEIQQALKNESKAQKDPRNANKYNCFSCNRYISSSSSYSNSCLSKFGWICGAVGIKANMPGYLLCAGAAALSCYVPAYKVCVSGSWKTTCPTQASTPAA